MKKELNEELSNIPNDKYAKFFDKFKEIDSLKTEDWKQPHLLGYFCKKYKETYQQEYAWKFNNPSPSKCFEVWQLKTLCAKLSANPKILKEYIDWVFKNEVPKVKTKFRSISFLTQDDRVYNYKMNVLLAGQRNLTVDRSTPLPSIYKDLLKDIADINTYGDLAFLSQMEPKSENLIEAMNRLIESGFDQNVLKRII